jgi:hypothetical protein
MKGENFGGEREKSKGIENMANQKLKHRTRGTNN